MTDPESARRRRAQDYLQRETDGYKIVIENGLGASNTYREIPDDMLQSVADFAQENDVPTFVHAINLDEYRRAAEIRPRAIVHGLEDAIPPGDPLLETLKKNNTYVVPTVVLTRGENHLEELAIYHRLKAVDSTCD